LHKTENITAVYKQKVQMFQKHYIKLHTIWKCYA